MVCGDSHTATHGALGALAFGIGSSEVAHVLATQTLWQPKPRSMRISVDGRARARVSPRRTSSWRSSRSIGAAGGTGHVIEYAGTAIRNLSMEGRLTLCNMSIEAGARAGMVAPDETTFAYLDGRPFAPKGAAWDKARRVLAHPAQRCRTPRFDTRGHARRRRHRADGHLGHQPRGRAAHHRPPSPIPDTVRQRRTARRDAAQLDYMGLEPGAQHRRHRRRPRVHRLLHQRPHRGSARRRRRRQAAAMPRCRPWSCPARAWCARRPRPRGWTPSSSTPASNGGTPAARCASA